MLKTINYQQLTLTAMSHAHFTRDDRVKLSALLKAGVEKIARILKKTRVVFGEKSKETATTENIFRGELEENRKRGKLIEKEKIENDAWLEEIYFEKLKLYWSPEQHLGKTPERKCHHLPRNNLWIYHTTQEIEEISEMPERKISQTAWHCAS